MLRFCLFWYAKDKRFLLSKENSLFEKRLSDKLTTFPKGSNLVSTFDRSFFSSWGLIAFMLDFVKLYFLHDGYDYLRFHRVACFFVSVWFCFSVGRLLLKDAAYELYWLLLLLFSPWFEWLNFTDEFRVCFSGICLP